MIYFLVYYFVKGHLGAWKDALIIHVSRNICFQFTCNKVIFDFIRMSLGKPLTPEEEEMGLPGVTWAAPHIVGWDDGRGYQCYDGQVRETFTFQDYISKAPDTHQGTIVNTVTKAMSRVSTDPPTPWNRQTSGKRFQSLFEKRSFFLRTSFLCV